MRLFELNHEYKTKDGKEITFVIDDDSEGDNNRGWQVHLIKAYIEGKQAGFIKLSYIPHERFKAWYPSLYHYKRHHGSYRLPGEYGKYTKEPLEQMDEEDLREFLKYLYSAGKPWRKNDLEEQYGDADVKNKVELVKTLKTIAAKEEKFRNDRNEFKRFKNYHVDKPIVDYIEVYDTENDSLRLKTKFGNVNFRRQGLGTELYKKAARYLKEKGLKLYASGIQSAQAEAAWNKMSEKGWVKREGKRRYLDPDLINELRGDSEIVQAIKRSDDITPSQNFNLIKLMARRGWKAYSGSYALVFVNDNYPYALKLYSVRDKCYDTFIKIAKRVNSPHFPVFKGNPINVRYFNAIRVEKLEPVSFNEYKTNLPLLAFMFENLGYEHALISIEKIVKDELKIDNEDDRSKKIKELSDQFQSEQPEFAKAILILKKVMPGQCVFDLHHENFMRRGNTWVITDPSYSEDFNLY
jgi:GNAT superfamily N-acetyltransferase